MGAGKSRGRARRSASRLAPAVPRPSRRRVDRGARRDASVAEIFAREGEAGFRARERAAIEALAGQRRRGGARRRRDRAARRAGAARARAGASCGSARGPRRSLRADRRGRRPAAPRRPRRRRRGARGCASCSPRASPHYAARRPRGRHRRARGRRARWRRIGAWREALGDGSGRDGRGATGGTRRVQVELGERSYAVRIGVGTLAGARRRAWPRPRRDARARRHRAAGRPPLRRGGAALAPRGGPRAPRASTCPTATAARTSRRSRGSTRRSSTPAPTAAPSLVALGGGMVGDLAGFAAATLLRGLPVRAGADHAARHDRLLRRRQDRREPAPRQEPGRRLPPAAPRRGRRGACSARSRGASSRPAWRR